MSPEQWNRVRELFHAALDVPPDKRTEFLNTRCEGADIRAEVGTLLSNAQDSLGVLDSPPLADIHSALQRTVSSSSNVPLRAGNKVGHYEILGAIGSGGMGEVYRARDLKLKREVALKILPTAFAVDPERMARFRREAEVMASLNHPNIAQLYGVEDCALVMELVEGKAPSGPLPTQTALNYARQMAEALEYAHEKGVVHRDLKPANIKVTPEGTLKLLDFGLAKAIELNVASGDTENSPTITMDGTHGGGVILGTAAYMAPEQARGNPADKRADIWSFGVVLYELYTGRRPFGGEDIAETLASVLTHEPDWSGLPAATPAHIRELLRWCLQKDRRQRLQSIGDARILLGRAARPPERSRSWVAWSAAALLAVAAIGGWIRSDRVVRQPPRETLTVVPPSGIELLGVGSQASAPEISPDGSAVFYKAGGGIYVRRLDSLEAKLLPGSDAATGAAFWSPDSTTVVYPVDFRLMKVRLPDGAPQMITPLESPSREGSWSDAGMILIAAYPLRAVPASGGEAVEVVFPGWRPGIIQDPEFLPDSNDFLFVFVPDDNGEETEIGLATFQGGKAVNAVRLMKNPTAARYTPAGGGRLLFVRDDNLYSQKFNRPARRLEGEAELVVRGVASQPSNDVSRGDFSVSRNGVVAWRPGKAALNQVTTFDRQGNRIGTTGPPGPFTSVILSPDEKRILTRGDRDWLLDVGQPDYQALPAGTSWFGWSPDGSKLLGIRAGTNRIEFSTASGEVRDLGRITVAGGLSDVSPDGKQVLSFARGTRGILITPLEGPEQERTSRILVQSDTGISGPRFSPDGRWILYNTGGAYGAAQGFFVQAFPGLGPRQRVAPPGRAPAWRRDGKEVVYIGELGVMSVAVGKIGNELRFGAPRLLFSGLRIPAGANAAARPLAVSRDGSRIYWPEAVEQLDSNMIHIKAGWLK